MLALEALNEAIAGWRKTKHPRFAAVAQWATARALAAEPPRSLVGDGGKKADGEAWLALLAAKDPLDLPRLLAAVGGARSAVAAERVLLLSKLNDPRVITGLLELLASPPFRARTALPFFRACAKALQDSGDPRVRSALGDLADRYKSIVETTVGADISALLRRAAESIDQVKPGPLPAAHEKKCAELEASFETERTQTQRGDSKSKSDQRSEDALLAAVYAAPDDDTPRLVFADALTERGDARGEFIALQIGRARGQSTPAQLARERELSADAKRRAAWGLPLSQGGECHVARGFPDQLLVDPRQLKTIIGHPAVSTLRSVSGFERGSSVKQATAFLFHQVASRLESVQGITQQLFAGLNGPLPWAEIALHFLPSREELARMPSVRALSLGSLGPALTESTFKDLGRLEKLVIDRVDGPVLAPLSNLVELTSHAWQQDVSWARALAGLPRLARLKIGSAPAASQLEGLSLTALECRFAVTLDVPAIVKALPRLEDLRVLTGGNSSAAAVGMLMASDALRGLRFAATGVFEISRPYTPEGVLEVRLWNRMTFAEEAQCLALVPVDCVTKVIIRPPSSDPWRYSGPAPEEALALFRAAAKVPVEMAWY